MLVYCYVLKKRYPVPPSNVRAGAVIHFATLRVTQHNTATFRLPKLCSLNCLPPTFCLLHVRRDGDVTTRPGQLSISPSTKYLSRGFKFGGGGRGGEIAYYLHLPGR